LFSVVFFPLSSVSLPQADSVVGPPEEPVDVLFPLLQPVKTTLDNTTKQNNHVTIFLDLSIRASSFKTKNAATEVTAQKTQTPIVAKPILM
jgi:hypothetical protein